MLSWVSPVLGWALKCLVQGHSQEKNPEDLVRLEPRTPGLRVKHFTTEPCGTLMGERNTVVSDYMLYRHLQQYCSHPFWIGLNIFMLLIFFVKVFQGKTLQSHCLASMKPIRNYFNSTRRQRFSPVQIESICRRQNKM